MDEDDLTGQPLNFRISIQFSADHNLDFSEQNEHNRDQMLKHDLCINRNQQMEEPTKIK